MKDYLVDVSVLLLFFNRPDRLGEVFAQVKKARPARLFLYQDGPRGSFEKDKIEACRAVVADEEIDWECDVKRHYEEKNSGCDPSGYLAQAWAFSQTDKLIVLEDDCVPSVSFFSFSKELLDKYEDTPRVWMIAGFNALEKLDLEESFFFADVFSIWGWASWKRVFDTWDSHYAWMDDKEKMNRMEEIVRKKRLRSDLIPMCKAHKAMGVPHFETIFWASMLLGDGVAIMTTKNQINNIGVEEDSTHFTTTLKTMPRRLRRQFLMPRYEISFPLCYPDRIEPLKSFKEEVYLLNAWDNPWRKVQYSFEELILNLRYFRFRAIWKAVKDRIKKSL